MSPSMGRCAMTLIGVNLLTDLCDTGTIFSATYRTCSLSDLCRDSYELASEEVCGSEVCEVLTHPTAYHSNGI